METWQSKSICLSFLLPISEEPEAYETNMGELFEFFKQGEINPAVYQSFKMDDFVSAFNLFKDRKVMGKVTLEFKK